MAALLAGGPNIVVLGSAGPELPLPCLSPARSTTRCGEMDLDQPLGFEVSSAKVTPAAAASMIDRIRAQLHLAVPRRS